MSSASASEAEAEAKRLAKYENRRCTCIASTFSPHRYKKCLLRKVVGDKAHKAVFLRGEESYQSSPNRKDLSDGTVTTDLLANYVSPLLKSERRIARGSIYGYIRFREAKLMSDSYRNSTSSSVSNSSVSSTDSSDTDASRGNEQDTNALLSVMEKVIAFQGEPEFSDWLLYWAVIDKKILYMYTDETETTLITSIELYKRGMGGSSGEPPFDCVPIIASTDDLTRYAFSLKKSKIISSSSCISSRSTSRDEGANVTTSDEIEAVLRWIQISLFNSSELELWMMATINSVEGSFRQSERFSFSPSFLNSVRSPSFFDSGQTFHSKTTPMTENASAATSPSPSAAAAANTTIGFASPQGGRGNDQAKNDGLACGSEDVTPFLSNEEDSGDDDDDDDESRFASVDSLSMTSLLFKQMVNSDVMFKRGDHWLKAHADLIDYSVADAAPPNNIFATSSSSSSSSSSSCVKLSILSTDSSSSDSERGQLLDEYRLTPETMITIYPRTMFPEAQFAICIHESKHSYNSGGGSGGGGGGGGASDQSHKVLSPITSKPEVYYRIGFASLETLQMWVDKISEEILRMNQ